MKQGLDIQPHRVAFIMTGDKLKYLSAADVQRHVVQNCEQFLATSRFLCIFTANRLVGDNSKGVRHVTLHVIIARQSRVFASSYLLAQHASNIHHSLAGIPNSYY